MRTLKAKIVELGVDNKKAIELFRQSLWVCAHDHILSKKLLDQFSSLSGRAIAIVGEWFDLDGLPSFDRGEPAPANSPPFSTGDYPQDKLVAFVSGYLKTTKNGIVVCENWAAERKHIAKWLWPPPKVACFGDKEVYNIVTPGITDPELIEAAVLARHHWQTNVCSTCEHVPEGDIPDEAFLDELVRNTRHIFIPAFDGSGYLVWSLAR